LEWIATEEERLIKEEEEAQRKRVKDVISQVLDLGIEESRSRVEELNRKMKKLKDDEDKRNRQIEKYRRQIERLKSGEDIDIDEDIDSEDEFLLEEENEVRNILLIGRTGSGKSTLANVLVNKNDNFEEVFKESSRSVSETKHIQTEKFTVDLSRDRTKKVNYLVIDTAGFGDTQLDNKDILKLLQNLVPIIRQNGLNQIFFVTGGRFTQPEIETYKLLESVLFDKRATKYTTIVRTNFEDFEDSKAREEDEQDLRKENPELFKILQASKIIYVDNPRMVGRSAATNRETRKESRKRLLTYLGTCQDNYCPEDLENISSRIDDYITSEEELKKEVELKEQIIQEEQDEFQKEVENIQTQKNRELKITERNFERQTQNLKNQNQRKLEATRQEFDAAHSSQLQKSREDYDESVREVKQVIQDNLNQISDSYNYIRVGEAVCCYGHDKNIQVYDKSGSLIPSYQSDFIGHIYCPTCREVHYN
jgi:GTP-binding protein EngB required for normal cell division